MVLKLFPKDVDIGELVEITMIMTQTTLLRVYEIVEFEGRALNEAERRHLDAMAHVFGLAKSDMRKLKKKRLN